MLRVHHLTLGPLISAYEIIQRLSWCILSVASNLSPHTISNWSSLHDLLPIRSCKYLQNQPRNRPLFLSFGLKIVKLDSLKLGLERYSSAYLFDLDESSASVALAISCPRAMNASPVNAQKSTSILYYKPDETVVRYSPRPFLPGSTSSDEHIGNDSIIAEVL